MTFVLEKRAFAYYEPKIHDWFVETGRFFVEIGASSRDIRLQGEVLVNGTVSLPITYSRRSAVADLAKTARGRDVMEQLASMGQHMFEAGEDSTSAMGEGSEKMMQQMMLEMPLSNLVSFGMMSETQLDQLLDQLNG